MTRLSAEIYTDKGKYKISNNLISISFSGQDRSDPSLPSWGIKSNSGYLEMYDTNGTIGELNREGHLANSEIRIYLNVRDRKEQIGGFYVVGANQDKQTLKTKIDFQDILDSWKNKPVPKYYHLYYPRTIYIKNILDDIIEKAGISVRYADPKTRNRIENLYIPYPTLNEGTLWGQMAKICEASSCYIYCDNEGIPTIHYSGDT